MTSRSPRGIYLPVTHVRFCFDRLLWFVWWSDALFRGLVLLLRSSLDWFNQEDVTASVWKLCFNVSPRSSLLANREGYGKPNVAIFNSFNFISSFVFCIQPCVQYSTCIQHSTRYSIFNFPFNIQLFILYSILHSPIQLSIQQFPLFIQHSKLIFKTFNSSFNIQLFIQHSTIRSTFNYSFNIQQFIQHSTFNYSYNIQLFIQHSTIHSTLLSPHYFWSVTQIIACQKHGGDAGYGNRSLCIGQIEASTCPPPPPRQPPGHWTFLKIIVQIPPYPGQNAVQMLHTRVHSGDQMPPLRGHFTGTKMTCVL